MVRKFLLSIVAVLAITISGFAQKQQISGSVHDATGSPVIGATIIVDGTSIGTTSGNDGTFVINAPSNGTLVVSYIGFQTQNIKLTGSNTSLDIKLLDDSTQLDDIVIVAYGTAKKSAFTGSASVLDSEQLAMRQVSNATSALAGAASGVQVVSANGQPGSEPKIRIRGVGSMSASNNPLYVLDGVPYDGDISSINTSDIASMTVLKDAAANAIYGARGANGVVLITTKQGSAGSTKVVVDAKWGNNSRAIPNYDVMTDPGMYYETYYKALYNSVAYNGGTAADAYTYADKTLTDKSGLGYNVYTVPEGEKLIGTNFKLNPNAKLGYSDGDYYYTPDNWYDEMFNDNNLRQEYNVSISGASDKTKYYMSAGYLNDNGIIEGSGFERYSVRLNADHQAKSWLKVGGNMSYAQTIVDSPSSQDEDSWGSSGNAFYVANNIAPIYPIYVRNADGSLKVDDNGYQVYDFGTSTNFTRAYMPMANPAISFKLDKNATVNDVINGKWYATATPIEGLNITANIGANIANAKSNYLSNPFYGSAVSSGGSVYVSHKRKAGINQQYLATYMTSFGNHSLDFLAGYEGYAYSSSVFYASRQNLFNPNVPEIDNTYAEDPQYLRSYKDSYATQGFLARVQYDYDGKYFASASFRRDASSRFAPDSRWGNFGSIGGAWLMSKESFLEDVDFVDMLKFKASYGQQGNDNLGNFYAYAKQSDLTSSDGNPAAAPTYLGNDKLTWETSHSFNSGFDFELFGGRLTGAVEYYARKTEDLLYNQPIPLSTGYAYLPTNVGSILNSGFEADLQFAILQNDDVQWTGNFNLTHNKNKILELAESTKVNDGIKGSNYHYYEGGSLYNSYMPRYAGVDKATGEALYYVDPDNGDWTKTAKYDEAQQSDLGCTLPAVYGGFGTTVYAYGFDLSIQCSYQLGGKMYDGTYEYLMQCGDSAGSNWHKDILNAWTPENTNTDVPRISTLDVSNQRMSDRFMVSSNYLSINNVSLGYTIPKSLTQKYSIQSVRLYVTGDNLHLFSARQGVDARQVMGLGSSTTSGNYSYAAMRSVSCGLTVTF